MTKSATAVPGLSDGHVSTVNMDGSLNEKKCQQTKTKHSNFISFSKYRMIKSNRVDGHKIVQIVFVRCVIAMPGDYIKTRMILWNSIKTN